MQNEHRVDNMEKSTDEKDDLHHPDNNETSNMRINPSEDSQKGNADIINNENISPSANGEKIASLSSEITSVISQDNNHFDDESHDIENIESKEDINKNDENGENNKNIEMAAQNVEELYTKVGISRIEEEEGQEMTNSTPPPKPPRLKFGSVEDTSNEKESSKENEEEKEKDDEEMKISNDQNLSAKTARKSVSAVSKKTIEDIENSIEKVEEDEPAEKSEKAEIDSTQDDADVVQSPPPRTGKTTIYSFQELNNNSLFEKKFIYYITYLFIYYLLYSSKSTINFRVFEFANKNCSIDYCLLAKMGKLFKGKRQQEVQNGTEKTSNIANPKAKVR